MFKLVRIKIWINSICCHLRAQTDGVLQEAQMKKWLIPSVCRLSKKCI